MNPYIIPGLKRNSLILLRYVSVNEIKATVAKHLGIPVMKLSEKTRKREVVTARQISMYISKIYTKLTHEEIGKRFCRDHSDVTYALKNVVALMTFDDQYRDTVNYLMEVIRSGKTIGEFIES